jgi:hypothetical protein
VPEAQGRLPAGPHARSVLGTHTSLGRTVTCRVTVRVPWQPRCQTPRQEPAAAQAGESEEALQEQGGQPSPPTTEEEELARAIQMSLTVQSPAAMPGYTVPPGTLPAGMPPAVGVARQPSEEEELEAAIAASLADQRQDTVVP